MFESAFVKLYLMDAYPDIDGDKRVIRLRCYLNPASHELVQEVDPAMASTLFHQIGSEWIPRSILSHCRFVSTIDPYSLTYCRDPEFADSHVFIPAVSITKLEAGKVTPESNDFALMFTVSFEKQDPKVLNDLSDLMHEHFYCTFAELQPSLFDKDEKQDSVMDVQAPAHAVDEPGREPGEENAPPREDPLAEEAGFINSRNKGRKKRGA